ncbi:hypothetical protein Bca101_026072 [Brassica carinata]
MGSIHRIASTREDRTRTGQAQQTEHGDLRTRTLSKRDNLAKNVWNGWTIAIKEEIPEIGRGRYGDSASSSSWRVKGYKTHQSQSRGRSQEQQYQEKQNEHRRIEYQSRSNSNSPDLQRTTSEIHKYNKNAVVGESNAAGRRQYSPRQNTRGEWQPNRELERRDRSPERLSEREAARETDVERRGKLKGSVTTENTSDKGTNSIPTRAVSGVLKILEPVQNELPGNQVNTKKNKETLVSPDRDIAPKRNSVLGTPSPHNRSTRDEVLEEKNQPDQDNSELPEGEIPYMTEEELKEYEKQYASVDLEMDEEMIDNDDRLGENMEEERIIAEKVVLETQIGGNKISGDQNKEKGARERDGEAKEKQRKETSSSRRELEHNKRPQKEKMSSTDISKRQGARSPDTKGLAASKKLANRGRVSPRSKQAKQGSLFSTKASPMKNGEIAIEERKEIGGEDKRVIRCTDGSSMTPRRWNPGIEGNVRKGSANLQEEQVGKSKIRRKDWERGSRWDSRLISCIGKKIFRGNWISMRKRITMDPWENLQDRING